MTARQPLLRIVSDALVLPNAHIDTDQIIPARFLTTTTRDGLGDHAFADWRGQGTPLDDPRAASCRILVAGDNFGCGSSREHAPWALKDFGFQAVISTSFADIFRTNALNNGLLTVTVAPDVHTQLLAMPWAPLIIDVAHKTLAGTFGTTSFPLDAFAHRCLTEGLDPLGWILAHAEQISAFEAARSQP